jgi:7-carboxy-7-deazaguanine synthase
MALDDVVRRVEELATNLVEITGGEPLVQANAFPLTTRLLDKGHAVLVETSGAVDVAPLDGRAHKIMDLKCPGSGEVQRNLWSNLDHLTERDEVKFVVNDRADYEWARETIQERGLDARLETGSLREVLISPVWGQVDSRELAEWILRDALPVRLQLQLHKLLWGPDTPGV